MDTLQTLQARIRAALANGDTLPSLAKRANLHRNTLYGYSDADWNPSMTTVVRLEAHLPETQND